MANQGIRFIYNTTDGAQAWESAARERSTERAAAEARKVLLERTMSDPLHLEFGRYLHSNRQQGLTHNFTRTAFDVLGEMRLYAALVLACRGGDLASWPDDYRAISLVQRIMHAVPFLWLDEVREAIPPARGVKLDEIEFPYDRMWWTFEKGMDGRSGDEPEFECVDAFLMERLESLDLQFVLFGKAPDGVPTVKIHLVRGDDGGRHAEKLIGQIAFINSPHVGKQQIKLDRATRRRMNKAGVADPPAVHMVTLRGEGSDSEVSGSMAPGNFSVRWAVRGHYRNQWYPSLEKNRLRWIDSYMKGPEGAPLQPKVYKVDR